MTEYGVQTTNLYALLETADEGAASKPKPKNKRKKKSQRGPPKDQAGAPQATQAKPAPVKKPEAQAAPKPQPQQQPKPVQQQPKPQASPSTNSHPRQQGQQGQHGAGSPGGQQQHRGGAGGRGGGSPGGGRGNNNNRGGGGGGGGNRGTGGPRHPQGAQHQDRRPRPENALHVEEPVAPEEAGDKQAGPRDKGKHVHNAAPLKHGREHDRRPGTGRSPTENKKGGSGSANWGKEGVDELAAEEDLKKEIQAEQTASPATGEKKKKKRNKKKKNKGKEEEEEEKKDEIPDEMLKTYEDFVKEQAEKNAALNQLTLPKPRQANENVQVDAPELASAVKLEKGKDTPVFFGAKEEQPAPAAAKEPQKLSKAAQKRERRLQAEREQQKKLQDETISNIFDFSKKAEPQGGRRDRGERGDRGGRGPRPRRDGEGGGNRGPREGRGNRPPHSPQHQQQHHQQHQQQHHQPKKFRSPESDAPHFDDSSFPALQVGPPVSLTAD